jgi:hypothetical protein
LAGRITRLVHLFTGIVLGGFQRGYARAVAQSTMTLREYIYLTCIGALNAFLAPVNAYIDFSLQVRSQLHGHVACSVRPAACGQPNPSALSPGDTLCSLHTRRCR